MPWEGAKGTEKESGDLEKSEGVGSGCSALPRVIKFGVFLGQSRCRQVCAGSCGQAGAEAGWRGASSGPEAAGLQHHAGLAQPEENETSSDSDPPSPARTEQTRVHPHQFGHVLSDARQEMRSTRFTSGHRL